jgi:poly-D-alanine transfer protein DltD
MTDNNTQNLAERIAQFLQQSENRTDDDFLRSSLEKINQRLDKIESQISVENSKFKIQNSKSNHPSQEKFKGLEELADEVIADLQNEKACPYEPTGKPCDHCAMCGSRGF